MAKNSIKIVLSGVILYALLLGWCSWWGKVTQGAYYFPMVILLLWFFRKKDIGNLFLPLALVWVAAILDSLGNFFGWYGAISWFDNLVHAFVSGALTLFSVHLLNRAVFQLRPLWMGPIAALIVLSITSFYEVMEYWGEVYFGLQAIWGEHDSPRDLQWNFIGVTAAFGMWLIFTRLRGRKKQNGKNAVVRKSPD